MGLEGWYLKGFLVRYSTFGGWKFGFRCVCLNFYIFSLYFNGLRWVWTGGWALLSGVIFASLLDNFPGGIRTRIFSEIKAYFSRPIVLIEQSVRSLCRGRFLKV
ncbi:MAG: hypothetical protein ACJAVO_002629 [Parvibaculaceae bacterium]|jgi:hypothetical protein|tara:strand:- start:306 stop:617 length:312 start_codon:yes stop_codon:yes gene_type:complete